MQITDANFSYTGNQSKELVSLVYCQTKRWSKVSVVRVSVN